MLDIAQAELHVAEAMLLGQLPAPGHHVFGHIHADDPARLSRPCGRQEDIDAGAGAQVQDGFANFEVSQRRGVAAAHPQNRHFRDQAQVLGRIAHGQALIGGRGPAGGAAESLFPPGDLAVTVLNNILQVLISHSYSLNAALTKRH